MSLIPPYDSIHTDYLLPNKNTSVRTNLLNIVTRLGVGTEPDANISATIRRVGGYPQMRLENYSGSIVNYATLYVDSSTYGGLTLLCKAGTTNPINIGYAPDGNQVNFACTTESTSTTSGSVVMAGGLGVAKRITAKNVTCTSAPTTATDIVRLGDLEVQTALSGTWGGILGTTIQTQGMELNKHGNMVFLSTTAAADPTATTSAAGAVTFSASIPAGYRPSTAIWRSVVNAYDTGESDCWLRVGTDGALSMYLTGGANIGSTKTFVAGVWSASWYT